MEWWNRPHRHQTHCRYNPTRCRPNSTPRTHPFLLSLGPPPGAKRGSRLNITLSHAQGHSVPVILNPIFPGFQIRSTFVQRSGALGIQ
jgi:hypothetical protein